TEALATELRLAGDRLRRDERVGPDGTGVDLVVHEVRELEPVDHAHRPRVIELLTAATIAQPDLACRRKVRRGEELDDGVVEAGVAIVRQCGERRVLPCALTLRQLATRGREV